MKVTPRRRLAAVAAVCVAAVAGPGVSTAAAHDSQYCEHGNAYGPHWWVHYTGEYDNTHGGGMGYNHYHWVDHSYRPQYNHGLYNWRHDRRHYCGRGGQGRSNGELAHVPGTNVTEPGPPVETPVDADAGGKLHATETDVQEFLTGFVYPCVQQIYEYRDPFCPGVSRTAPAGLATTQAVQLVVLSERQRFPDRPRVVSAPTATASGDQCVLGAAARPTARTPNRIRIELADRGLAARLGHGC